MRRSCVLKLLNDHSVSGVTRNSPEEQILTDTVLFIIDEAPTQPKFALETENRVLRFLTGNRDVPFGGKIFVLGGDRRQTLPVVPRVINMSVRDYCIFSSDLWEHFQV